MPGACLARHARVMRSYMRLRPRILPESCSTMFGWTGIYLTQWSRLSSLMRRFPCRSEAKCGFLNDPKRIIHFISLGFFVPNSWKSSDSDCLHFCHWDVCFIRAAFPWLCMLWGCLHHPTKKYERGDQPFGRRKQASPRDNTIASSYWLAPAFPEPIHFDPFRNVRRDGSTDNSEHTLDWVLQVLQNHNWGAYVSWTRPPVGCLEPLKRGQNFSDNLIFYHWLNLIVWLSVKHIFSENIPVGCNREERWWHRPCYLSGRPISCAMAICRLTNSFFRSLKMLPKNLNVVELWVAY